MPDEFPLDAEKAIWLARPHAVAETALRVVGAHPAVREAQIYLADYPMGHLVPVTTGPDALRIDTTPEGRAFAAQQIITETPSGPSDGPHRTHLPLTVHGDRIGILSLSFDTAPEPGVTSRFTAFAATLARALKIADSTTDAYRRIRRRNHRLTLAAEMQWDLLPGRSCVCPEYELAGHLEPAYAICGDNYDWSAAEDRLTITVSNGMGQGIEAAMLTHLAITTMRNARRSGAGLRDQAGLANEIIHSFHGGELNVATLLLEWDVAGGKVRAVDAGSPQLWRMRAGSVDLVRLEEQLPLGMFYDTVYVEEEFAIEPGDRLVVVSDGVHTARSPSGDLYSTGGLPRALRATRLQDPSEAVRTLTRELLDYHQGGELLDDAVILCLDRTPAAGRPDPE